MEKHIPVLKNEVVEYLNPEKSGVFADGTLGAGGHSRALLEKFKTQSSKFKSNLKSKTRNKKLEIIGIDCDSEAIEIAKKNSADYKNQVIFVNDDFVNLHEIVHKLVNSSRLAAARSNSKVCSSRPPHLAGDSNDKKGSGSLSGVLFDLGMSSMQIENSGRGFSFRRNEVLDMRLCKKRQDQKVTTSLNQGIASSSRRDVGTPRNDRIFGSGQNKTAEEIVNEYPEDRLKEIFYKYGEERFAPRIAREITRVRKDRKIKTTKQLVEVISMAMPRREKAKRTSRQARGKRIHFATKVFQALRIEVNQELEKLEKVIPEAIELLKPGGRIAIISFHSLEDRIVKQTFKKLETGCVCPKSFVKCMCGQKPQIKIITKKPVRPSEEEIKKNPRSRSAKLRVAEKI